MNLKKRRNRTLRNVAGAIAAGPKARARILARAAEVANHSRHVRAIEEEFDVLGPEILEAWAGRYLLREFAR
jgi:hypothetical protein